MTNLLGNVPLDVLGTFTPSALLGLCVIFIIIGKLIPANTHTRELAEKDRQITYLHDALNACRDAEEHRTAQVIELLEYSRSIAAVMRSLRTRADGESPE